MPKFTVCVQMVVTREVEVDAVDVDQARELAEERAETDDIDWDVHDGVLTDTCNWTVFDQQGEVVETKFF